MMNDIVPPKLYNILKKLVNKNVENFEITSYDPNKKGEGYMGQTIFISLRDRSNGDQFNYVVKQAFSDDVIRKYVPVKQIFLNEINFYTKLWPKLKAFQDRIPSINHFTNLGKCVETSSEENMEMLVLENLKFQGYVMHDKKKVLDKSHFEFIFKIYGRFHAISFAYKALNPEDFFQLVDGGFDNWKILLDLNSIEDNVKFTHETVLKSLGPGFDDAIIEKYKHYVDDGMELIFKSLSSCQYSAIVHGDCWSNNMMFKYDDSGELIDLKLLDFQFTRYGSPAFDLSYCLYCGGTKEIFDDLDHLLKVYHGSLSENLQAFGCDPEKLYPLEALKNDWKKFCQLSIYMSLSVWKLRLTYDEEIMDLTDLEESEEMRDKYYSAKYDEKEYKERVRDIITHLFENDYLY